MPNINTHLGSNIEWTVYRNGHNELECRLTLDGVAYNISTLSFSVYFRRPQKDDNKLTLIEEPNGLTNGGATGILTIPLTEANLITLPADRYFILIEYTLDGKKYPLAQGFVTISNETNPGKTTDSVTIPVNISGVQVNMAVTIPGSSGASTASQVTFSPSGNIEATNVQAAIEEVAVNVIQLACSDETTALTAGTGKITFRMPHTMTLSAVRASLTTAQDTGLILTVDINKNGVSILSTKLTIDNTEKTSLTAATAAVISDTALPDDAEITVDIDQIGDGTGKGLKITLIGS